MKRASAIRRSSLSIILLAFFAGIPPAFAQNAAQPKPVIPAQSEPPAGYLNTVLDLMQTHALHTKEINWPAVRRETLARAAGAQSTADTYPAIAYALTQLKERHSFLKFPVTMPEVENKKVSAAMDAILAPYKQQFPSRPKSVFHTRSTPAGSLIHIGDAVFADVIIPTCWQGQAPSQPSGGNYFQNYADSLHSTAAALQAGHPQGWIIDLRGNGGGNMYPMLAGIGFVLGEGRLGYFTSVDGTEEDYWFYRQGAAGDTEKGKETILARISGPLPAVLDLPPVAVLLDGGTASSGEATAISFLGRPHTRTFGAHTAGFTTANHGFPLSDGAMLFLSTTVEEGRDHHIFPDGVEPDVALPQPTAEPSEQSDAVLQAAEEWLILQR